MSDGIKTEEFFEKMADDRYKQLLFMFQNLPEKVRDQVILQLPDEEAKNFFSTFFQVSVNKENEEE